MRPSRLAGLRDLRLVRVSNQDVDAWAQTLDADEVARSKRFRFEEDRRRFIVGRGLLRQMLGVEIGAAPQSFRFAANAHGKPSLADAAQLAFNVAHSGDYVLVGVAHADALGVDVEKHRSDFDVLALGRRVFTDAEQRRIADAPGEAQVAAFFRQWAFKEAVVKAVGVGLSLDLQRFEIAFDGEGAALVSNAATELGPPSSWRLQSVPIAPGYSAALAIRYVDQTPATGG